MKNEIKLFLEQISREIDAGEPFERRFGLGNAHQKYQDIVEAARSRGVKAEFDDDERSEFVVDKDGAGGVKARISGPLDPWYGFDHTAFIKALDNAGEMKSLTVLIDSPGGSVWSGLALYRDLARRRADGVTVRTEAAGLVASAATLPFIAGETRVAGLGSLFMIHAVSGLLMVYGTVEEGRDAFEKWENAMGAADQTLRSIYTGALDMSADEVEKAMTAETWYSAEEALKAGLVTAIDDDVDARAKATAGELSPERQATIEAIAAQHRKER